MKRATYWLLALVIAVPLFAQSATKKARVNADVARLASLLHDVQSTATVQAGAWKTIGNEANVLTNRIYANTAGSPEARAAARDLRLHVREMRNAALKGDAAGARDHAKQAMPAAWKLIEWSTPA
ncbi:MAG TPA: hypothetical protein VGR02_04265 [Thermoanaerobaculia bacterium]|nr:hypothetical protein [Thermoanaerobaculia bacterium]